MIGLYETTRIELLRDLYVWAYERSTQEYLAIRRELVAPDPFRAQWRADHRGTAPVARWRAGPLRPAPRATGRLAAGSAALDAKLLIDRHIFSKKGLTHIRYRRIMRATWLHSSVG
ncbi:hypothetical protein SFA35_04495 [Pseudomonas sp. HR96]|uniref:hypothetical protein n=1 Tax=Pseudomonas sp. HR96 TaxID=1027966 RepID=UPI002A74AC1E|nr:hypothetical protein [Pseudomonas sp. HR96]WPP00640.1 hypothetical protein SFA35_04495 [Pseudomonas sp. HR96]